MIDDIKDTFMAEHDSIVKNITNIGKNALETVGTDDWQVERKKTYQQLYKDNWKHNDYFIHFEMNISVETMMNRSPVLWMLDIEGSLKQDIRDMLEFSIKDYGFTLINNSRTIFRLEIDIFDDEGNISQAQIHKNIESCVDKCQPLIKDIDNLVASYDDSQLVK